MRISFSVSLSDILPGGRVILSLRESDIENYDFSVILFALKLSKAISLGFYPNITAKQ